MVILLHVHSLQAVSLIVFHDNMSASLFLCLSSLAPNHLSLGEIVNCHLNGAINATTCKSVIVEGNPWLIL